MALTNIKYVGIPGCDEGYAATICQEHNYRDTARFVYQLQEIECPACIARADREWREQQERAEIRAELAARRGHPSICLCPACAPSEAEYDRMQAEEDARLFVAEVISPNYCDHHESPMGFPCGLKGCRHAACKVSGFDFDQDPPF